MSDRTEDDEQPWDEARWLKFMKEGEVRAARYGELLETFMDDPDCHNKVAREMGWDVPDEIADGIDELKLALPEADDDFCPDDEPPFDAEALMEEALAEIEEGKFKDEDEDGPLEERDLELQQIPAYAAAWACGMEVDKLLDPWMKQQTDEEIDDRIPEAWINIHIACAKISGGHAMGYEDDVICGNIVCNRFALEAVDKCIDRLTELRDDRVVPADKVDAVLPQVRQVRDEIESRIEELRQRVWW